MRRKILPILMIFAVVACTGHKSNKPVALMLSLQKGKTYRLSIKFVQTMGQTVHDMRQNITTTLRGNLSFYVKNRLNGRYFLDGRFETLHFNLQAPRMTVTFDSDQKPRTGNVSDQIFARFVSQPFHIVMDHYGSIISVSGIDSLGHAIVDTMEIANPLLKMQYLENFKGLVGNRALKGTLSALFAFYPAKAVKISQSWDKKLSVPSPIPAVFKTTYKLADFDSSQALIKGKSLIESQPVQPEAGGLKIDYEIEGSQTSEIKIRPKDGWIKTVTMQSEITGTMKVQKSPQIPHGLQIPFTLKTSSSAHSL